MKNRWSEEEASRFIARYAPLWGEDLALRTYVSRLLGEEKALVLHGGGNTSVKGETINVLGENVPTIFVKASGWDLASIEPEGHSALDLTPLQRLQDLSVMDGTTMVRLLRTHRLDPDAATPSIETLLHVFLPYKFVDHTHADAILALTNQHGGDLLVAEALGADIIILSYVHPGFSLAQAVVQALAKAPHSRGMVLMKHGLLTWGETAQASYDATVQIVNQAEAFIAQKVTQRPSPAPDSERLAAQARYLEIAPRLRGALAIGTEDPDHPFQRFVLRPLIEPEILAMLESSAIHKILVSAPLTTDHLIRTKPLPLWIESPEQMETALEDYRQAYQQYILDGTGQETAEAAPETDPTSPPFDSSPRVILMPGIGIVCVGKDQEEADIARDLTIQTIAAKSLIARMGGSYEGVTVQDQYAMEHYAPQRAKLARASEPLMGHRVALVTGAAGAIGSGICRELLNQGCHLAVSDLPGKALTSLVDELQIQHGERVLSVAMDVTNPESVAHGMQQVVKTWGGLDLLVLNAGLAHVASLEEMNPEDFLRLQRVNVEGTLHLLTAVTHHFRAQGTGGDVVLISTKNVFAPGASFGAYSATKAAAHQLARVASLELAPLGVRVNMVAPDGVFSDGARSSGLWAEVGPKRMRSRGLDAAGLEAYYQNRNLLKAQITAKHVARAVLFFATRQTPSTGITLPVDGGLPDATPR